MHSVGNTVSNTAPVLYGDRGYQTNHGNHVTMYKNIKSLCCTSEANNNTVSQSHFNKKESLYIMTKINRKL